MANCVKCGKHVGCGCQLVNGVCSTCRNTPPPPPPPPKSNNNVDNSSNNNQ